MAWAGGRLGFSGVEMKRVLIAVTVNVLYIIQFLGIGGTEKQLVGLIRGLQNNRFQPHLCTLSPSGGFFDELTVPKIQLQFSSFLHLSLLSSMAQLSAFIHRHKIRLVQTFFQDPFLLAAMMKPFHQFKLIGSFRDLGFWRTPAEVRKMRMAYPFFEGFIANSQAVKEYFVRMDRIPRRRIEVVPNGIEVGEAPASIGEPPVVGIVANCNRPVKRVQDFIQAAALVHRHRPETRFMILGDGPLRHALEELSRSLGMGDALTFAGQLPDPLDMVRSFRVGVITSETEGFCNAILEYMACGVPVVATAAGGNPELVRDGENGFLVPVGDVKGIAEKIELLLAETTLHKQMAITNRARVTRDFSMQRMIAEHISFYDSVLAP